MTESSHRAILRSSSIVGGAQVINIIMSLAKLKAVALLLGPAGVGLAGIYANLMQAAASTASLGIGNVGTRQIAVAHADGGDLAVGRARRTIFWGAVILAVIGAATVFLARNWLARETLGDASRGADVAWLALGVALTVAAVPQGAVLTGLRRIGDLARVNIGAGALGATLGVFAIWHWGTHGLIAMVLAAPLASVLLGVVFVARLGPPAGKAISVREMLPEWRAALPLGAAFMVGGSISSFGQLAVRALVQRQLGAEALGHFQAAWVIGMTYLGFVLNAMGTDYYPRLTASINDHAVTTRLVNEQTEVVLLLSAPVLLTMLGFAPWVVSLLYSPQFAPTVDVLRWQILGDIFKVVTWPIGFLLLARGSGKTFVFTESIGMSVYVLGVFIGLPLIGVRATGVAFLALYVVQLPLVWWVAGRRIDFHWSPVVIRLAVLLVLMSVLIDIVSFSSEVLGAVFASLGAIAMGTAALLRLSEAAGAAWIPKRMAELGKKSKLLMVNSNSVGADRESTL